MYTKKSIQYGEHTLTIETGRVARQASGAALVDLGGTIVLATAVGIQDDEIRSFFPVRVDYQEKYYASGKIPGGFLKREGRPSERETLISRLIDRPLRPLFDKRFTCEVQIIATVLSINPQVDSDIVAMIASSAALAISGIPHETTMAAARVGYKDGMYILNPTNKELASSSLDLVVAGTDTSVLMVESEASELTEEVMLGAVMFGHHNFQPVIELINDVAKEAGKPRWDWQPAAEDTTVYETISAEFATSVEEAYQTTDKLARQKQLSQIRDDIKAKFLPEEPAEGATVYAQADVTNAINKLESNTVREKVLNGQPRIDGRTLTDVRKITVDTSVLPRVHGTSLFTRGETQALVAVTLGSNRDAQILDGIYGEEKDRFMLHYNFPPYSVNEVGFVGSPKRREIGHGRLARRGIAAVLPTESEFPYVMRVVSEITESNGSSSMASVCGSSLALMDAGVPIKAPVAGIAMGLVKEGDKFAVLTDILGDEDHLGDMDFKVAGTSKGVTALQMDIKISGITEDIMSTALEQAKDGRMHILGIMNDHISAPRETMSEYAPRMEFMKVDPDKIKVIIGKGGATIKELTETTGATIDIKDDGTVQISAADNEALSNVKKQIELLTADVEVGQTYEGKINKIVDFGAFVNILPGKDGLLHISEIAHKRVNSVSDELSEGQNVEVKVLAVDRQGKIKLSMKALIAKPAEAAEREA